MVTKPHSLKRLLLRSKYIRIGLAVMVIGMSPLIVMGIIDPERNDAAGLPLARIHSHLEEMEIDRLAFIARTARDMLRASGVEKRWSRRWVCGFARFS